MYEGMIGAGVIGTEILAAGITNTVYYRLWG